MKNKEKLDQIFNNIINIINDDKETDESKVIKIFLIIEIYLIGYMKEDGTYSGYNKDFGDYAALRVENKK